ncbi:Ankyrin-1 [Penicillium subrubescens]|uniref:Ankyrin-1 n=1 Tax=Penicillium subrubescens TaxID=1316194 RepID=A0A1Q5TG76_9EURO|nr:Ankyrin-1 [Penicillium subrubescens]
MSLLGLPNELLLMIAEQMSSSKDINAMAQADRFTYALLNKYLYDQNIRKSGSSALLWAAKHGQLGTAQRLIKGGANIETYPGPLFQRPLHVAATYGNVEVAQLLVDHGAKITFLDGHFKTALHHAAENGHAAIVQMLLRHGHLLMEQTNHLVPETPLHQAAKYGHAEIVRLLLAAGCKVNVTKFGTGETALHLSLEHFKHQIRHKGKGKKISVKKRDARKAKTAVLLIEHGADVRALPRSNKTPLELAIRVSYVDVVRHLLKKGASPNVRVSIIYSNLPPSPTFPFSTYTPPTTTIMDLAKSCGNNEIIYLLHDAQNKMYATSRNTL